MQTKYKIVRRRPKLSGFVSGLDTIMISLEDAANKANLAVGLANEEFFYRYHPEKDSAVINYYFKTAGTYCDIAWDYVTEIRKQIQEIQNLAAPYLEPETTKAGD